MPTGMWRVSQLNRIASAGVGSITHANLTKLRKIKNTKKLLEYKVRQEILKEIKSNYT